MIANGIRKCNAKNRVRVALSTGIVQPAGREHKEQTTRCSCQDSKPGHAVYSPL